MNDIVRPLTPDGMVGWDAHNQLWLWKVDGDRKRGAIIGDPRGHICPVCQQGWELTAQSLEDQTYWSRYEEWAHRSCLIRADSLQERDMWFDALVAAGIRFKGLEKIPNEYWGRDPWYSKKPWYRVRLLDTNKTLKLGCRKRVFHMEIEPGGEGHFNSQVAKAAWEKEKVTQEITHDSLYIHAWGEVKARIYMLDFAKILGLDKESPKPDVEDMMKTGESGKR